MELKGGDKLTQALAKIAGEMTGSVRVGFLEGSTYPDGTPTAAVAFWNEFGTTDIPPRPFFRTTISNMSGAWGKRLGDAAVHFDYDGEKVLNLMGQTMAEDVQSSITGWTDPANAESTIASKGFNAPLRDTNHMHDSVDYEVKS